MSQLLIFVASEEELPALLVEISSALVLNQNMDDKTRKEVIQRFSDPGYPVMIAVGSRTAVGWRAPEDTEVLISSKAIYAWNASRIMQALSRPALKKETSDG